jgi:hypothetical protein
MKVKLMFNKSNKLTPDEDLAMKFLDEFQNIKLASTEQYKKDPDMFDKIYDQTILLNDYLIRIKTNNILKEIDDEDIINRMNMLFSGKILLIDNRETSLQCKSMVIEAITEYINACPKKHSKVHYYSVIKLYNSLLINCENV